MNEAAIMFCPTSAGRKRSIYLSDCYEWYSVMSGYHEKNQRREEGYGSENVREAMQINNGFNWKNPRI